MQFNRLPKAIHTAERVLPELDADCMKAKSVQNIDVSFVQKPQEIMKNSWGIKWSKS